MDHWLWKEQPYDISTHSLTRRLTFYKMFILVSFNISTHSLTRRLTSEDCENHSQKDISTHSLTRRLTLYRCRVSLTCENFNSQPHKEADNTRSSNV